MNLVAVGKVVGCFGVDGYVKVRPHTSSPDRFRSLRQVYLGPSAGEAVRIEIEDTVVRRESVLVKFDTIRDRTEGELLAGQYLFVDESEVPVLPPGSYYVDELIGSAVWTTGGEFVGTLEDVLKLPAQDVWAIRGSSGVHLVPAVREFVARVEKGKVILNAIEGLLEA